MYVFFPKNFCLIIYILFLFAARKDIAIEMYKKGIRELERGIAVDVSGEGN
jgi:hypothetical protein